MRQYLKLLDYVLENGVNKDDRTGTGTRSVFGYQMRFDLSMGFPLLTTKKLHYPSIIYELLWFLKGADPIEEGADVNIGKVNIKYLNDNNVHIWDKWADEDGNLGCVYGAQWRSWPDYQGGHIDQIANIIHEIKTNPDSRRLIVSAWNPALLEDMRLPPCHCLFQFYVADGKLSCQLYQRSGDIFIGVPFNIASYSLLTMMIAQICGLKAGEFIHTLGDAHLYNNHLEQAREQAARAPKPLPKMNLNPDVRDIFSFRYEDFKLEDYDPHPHIKAAVAV